MFFSQAASPVLMTQPLGWQFRQLQCCPLISQGLSHAQCIHCGVGKKWQQHHCSRLRLLNFVSTCSHTGTQLPLPGQWAEELKGRTGKKLFQEGFRQEVGPKEGLVLSCGAVCH